MNEKDEIVVSPDEEKSEQEALADVSEADIRAKVISELGLSEEHNKELIDKTVQREIAHRKELSTAIGQKRSWRDKAKQAKPAAPAADGKPLNAEEITKQAREAAREELEQRDLDEMEVSDEIKTEIKRIAKLNGTSVRQAAKDPYIQFLNDKAKRAGRVEEATPERTPRSRPAPKSDTIPTFDMKTPEGRKKYQEWKASGRGQA